MSRFRMPKFIERFFDALGPGLISGAADDDPSGIATYSITGAQLGTSLLWTALMTCARIGMCSGYGIAHALRRKWPRFIVALASMALLAANIINIGADLAGM